MTYAQSFSRIFHLAALVLAGASLGAWAQTSTTSKGYATDKFDGFEPIDKEGESLQQKEKSFWYSISETTPQAQLDYCIKKEAEGSLRAARKGYEALVREWPTSAQAATAQMDLANLYEKRGKYERAFDEYQYLLTFYTGQCHYNEILDKEYRLANALLHNNRSMFGWVLSGTDSIRERFEKIVRNAPRSSIAPEVMLIIGSIRVSAGELEEAIAVYDGLLNRFPSAPQAVSATFLAAQCRHTLAVKHHYNEARCREAIGFFKAVLARQPNHPQKQQMTAWLNELTSLLSEQNYQRAVFYDTKQRNVTAAKSAYQRFLTDFPDSTYAPRVRERLAQLEKSVSPAPAK